MIDEQLISTIIGQSPIIAVLIFFIFLVIRDRKEVIQQRYEKETKHDTLEKEFRQYIADNEQKLLKIVAENTSVNAELVSLMRQLLKKGYPT